MTEFLDDDTNMNIIQNYNIVVLRYDQHIQVTVKRWHARARPKYDFSFIFTVYLYITFRSSVLQFDANPFI